MKLFDAIQYAPPGLLFIMVVFSTNRMASLMPGYRVIWYLLQGQNYALNSIVPGSFILKAN